MITRRYIGVIVVMAAPLCLFSMTQWNADNTQPEDSTHPYNLVAEMDVGQLNTPANNPLTVEGVALGRLLFYDPLLSGNGTYSCGSCHKQEYSFTDGLPKAIGAKGDTLEFNTMSLVNLAWQKEFFWDGRASTLEELVYTPITHPKEMGQDTAKLVGQLKKHPHYSKYFRQAFGSDQITFTQVSMALAQFLRTLVTAGIMLPDSVLNMPPPDVSEHDFAVANLHEPTYRGLYFRLSEMCASCHISKSYAGIHMDFNMVNDTSSPMKIPPLVNIKYTGPYMHDGRFATLYEVLEHYEDHIGTLAFRNRKGGEPPHVTKLSEYDKREIIQFLDYFTDTTLLTNPAYGNPFTQIGFVWTEHIYDTYPTKTLSNTKQP